MKLKLTISLVLIALGLAALVGFQLTTTVPGIQVTNERGEVLEEFELFESHRVDLVYTHSAMNIPGERCVCLI